MQYNKLLIKYLKYIWIIAFLKVYKKRIVNTQYGIIKKI